MEQQSVETFIYLGSEVNIMNPDVGKKFGLQVCKTKISAQKIDGSKLDTFDIVITCFLVEDKEKSFRFFEKIFLFADISMDIILDMSFLTLSNVKIHFVNCYIY